MPTNFTVAMPEELATQGEKYAAEHDMTLEELIVFLCEEACDAQPGEEDGHAEV